ncbi:MAG: type II toxin-antitoxin system RelE family toxin [Solirubrobacteraceae bacterium]
MSYEITLAPAAARQLRKFGPQVRRRIQAALELLAETPRPPAATRLVGGAGEWRIRTGACRIIYEISEGRLLVLVLRSGHWPIADDPDGGGSDRRAVPARSTSASGLRLALASPTPPSSPGRAVRVRASDD